MGYHDLFQGIFLTQGLNSCLLCLLQWQAGSFTVMPPGKPLQLVIYGTHEIVSFLHFPSLESPNHANFQVAKTQSRSMGWVTCNRSTKGNMQRFPPFEDGKICNVWLLGSWRTGRAWQGGHYKLNQGKDFPLEPLVAQEGSGAGDIQASLGNSSSCISRENLWSRWTCRYENLQYTVLIRVIIARAT